MSAWDTVCENDPLFSHMNEPVKHAVSLPGSDGALVPLKIRFLVQDPLPSFSNGVPWRGSKLASVRISVCTGDTGCVRTRKEAVFHSTHLSR